MVRVCTFKWRRLLHSLKRCPAAGGKEGSGGSVEINQVPPAPWYVKRSTCTKELAVPALAYHSRRAEVHKWVAGDTGPVVARGVAHELE